MKKTIKYLALACVMVAGLAACQKSEAPDYEAAPAETGEQVFFPTAPAATVKLTKGEPSLTIAVSRASAVLDAVDVNITASGDALEYFTIPNKVSFAAEAKSTDLVITAKDVNGMPMNEFYPLTIAIADEIMATSYGARSLSFSIGIELPWITFDAAGTMKEIGWWGEEEPGKPMKYQQISDNMRYCVVEDCWGHDTIAGGNDYDVQPYVWYWDTETNYCYVPAQFMGYSTSSGDVYVSDEAAFYNLYWNMQEAGKNGSGLEQGTDEWFAWHDARRAAWGGPDGDPFPYYDGEGKFYLGDFFFLMADGQPTGRGYAFGGTQDVYECSFAVNYTVGVSYEGLLLDKEGVEQILGELTVEGRDVTDVYVHLVPGKDPSASVAILEAEDVNLEEVPNLLKLSAAGSFRIPMIEEAEAGFYTLVAVPVDKTGEALAWDYAVYETFTYGELDPIYLEYTAEDFIAGVAKDKLLGTQWVAYAAGYDGAPTDRAACAYVTFADAEDNDAGDDLITCSGLANTTSFADTFTMEYYQGAIYALAPQEIGTYSSYTVHYASYGEEFAGNYGMCGAYVADGIIAFVNNSNSDNVIGIGFWAYSGETLAGYLRVREYLLLVDPGLLASSAPKQVATTLGYANIPFAPAADNSRHELAPYNWRRDVVASGKVLCGNASKEVVELKLK